MLKHVNDEVRPGIPDLTDEQEIALALVLWRWWHFRYRSSNGNRTGTDFSEKSGYKALELAKKIGLEKEFMEMLMSYPIMSIYIKEIPDEPIRRRNKPKTSKSE